MISRDRQNEDNSWLKQALMYGRLSVKNFYFHMVCTLNVAFAKHVVGVFSQSQEYRVFLTHTLHVCLMTTYSITNSAVCCHVHQLFPILQCVRLVRLVRLVDLICLHTQRSQMPNHTQAHAPLH